MTTNWAGWFDRVEREQEELRAAAAAVAVAASYSLMYCFVHAAAVACTKVIVKEYLHFSERAKG